MGSIPRLGRAPGLANPPSDSAWRILWTAEAIVHGVAELDRTWSVYTQEASECEGIVTLPIPRERKTLPVKQDTALYILKLNFQCQNITPRIC